jgi:pimeloyl-ACP methyl ester carboxylesterase
MPSFRSFDGTSLYYERFGTGEPIVLLHSFPFDSRVWTGTGVIEAIAEAGRTAVMLDRRGGGRSDRPRDPAAYAGNACARDASSLIDHLGADRVDLGAYSLGSMIGLRVLQADRRVRRAVLGGIGDGILSLDPEAGSQVAAELETDDIEALPAAGRALRERIERLGGDRLALAALWRGPFVAFDTHFDHVTAKTLVITGQRDRGFGDPNALAARLPYGTVFQPPTDHVSTMTHPSFAEKLVAHLNA